MLKNNLYGIIIALIAVLIISPDTLFMIWGDMPAFQMVAWRGILAGLCYLVIWIISTRSLIKKDLPFVLPMGLGVFISGVVGLFVTQYEHMMTGNVLPIAITGIFVLPIPMYLLSYASRYTRATNVSLILLLESVLGPLWIWLGTGDQPTDLTLFGGFIVIFSTGSYLLISKQN